MGTLHARPAGAPRRAQAACLMQRLRASGQALAREPAVTAPIDEGSALLRAAQSQSLLACLRGRDGC
eukprot:6199636-Pleurochrysis_carterae.AAC.5